MSLQLAHSDSPNLAPAAGLTLPMERQAQDKTIEVEPDWFKDQKKTLSVRFLSAFMWSVFGFVLSVFCPFICSLFFCPFRVSCSAFAHRIGFAYSAITSDSCGLPICNIVAIDAMGLFGIQARRAVCAQPVNPWWNGFDMDRIYTGSVVALMVCLQYISAHASWQRLHKPSKQHSMREGHFSSEVNGCISIAAQSSCPFPAWSVFVERCLAYLDFTEDAGDVFQGKMFNGKVLPRHFSLRNRLVCLEPVGVVPTLQPVRSAL